MPEDEQKYRSPVMGETCVETDIIMEDCWLPKLEEGDWLLFEGIVTKRRYCYCCDTHVHIAIMQLYTMVYFISQKELIIRVFCFVFVCWCVCFAFFLVLFCTSVLVFLFVWFFFISLPPYQYKITNR